ncbi:ER6L2 protein, partial [Turnix velox]|nr:ER6L2 protein [Turnix velox]
KNAENPEEDTSEDSTVKGGQEMLVKSKRHHLYVMHPVMQKIQKVHRVGSTTILIGKTPKGICRRQFEKMVSHFNMGSAEELAEHIAKATSETRQKMLKEFYVSKYPEMEPFFPAEILTQASCRYETGELGTTCSRRRKSIVNLEISMSKSSDNGLLSSGTTETETQQNCKRKAEQLHNDSCVQNVCDTAIYKQSAQHIKNRNSQVFKDSMVSGSLNSTLEVIDVPSVKSCEGQQDSIGTQVPTKRSLSPSESEERSALTCKRKSYMDLLGDTSVLNDLFGNGGDRPTDPPTGGSLAGQVEKSKERPKDFWDMLSDQDEESLRKLMDVAVIEKLCKRTLHPPLTKEIEVCDSFLWKKNENFVWKKDSPDD